MSQREVDMEEISRRKAQAKRVGKKWPKTTKTIVKVGERDFPPYGG